MILDYDVLVIPGKDPGSIPRMLEHKNAVIESFTKRYGLAQLVYVESYKYVHDALRREKQLKGWQRQWKIDLIEQKNPQWADLYDQFFKS